MACASDKLYEEYTAPIQANDIREGDVVVLRETHPCKIVSIDRAKPGKHGHAKTLFTGFDIFTGQRYSEQCPSQHTMPQIHPVKSKYQVLGIEAGMLTLIDESDVVRTDVAVPTDASLLLPLQEGIRHSEQVEVTVLSACGTVVVIAVRVLPSCCS